MINTALELLLSGDIPVVYLSDSVSSVLQLMLDEHLSSLPLVEKDTYFGLVTEDALLEIENTEITIEDCRLHWLQPAINTHTHPFDAIKLMDSFHLPILPVVDDNNIYLGAITKDAVIQYLANQDALKEPGGIIVLEVKENSYSLAEIARICESNDVIILNASVYTNPETLKLEVTIKLNKTNLQFVIATFERYEYTIISTFGNTSANNELSDKYNQLMKFINM